MNKALTRFKLGMMLRFSKHFIENMNISESIDMLSEDVSYKFFKAIWAEELDKVEIKAPAEDDPNVMLTHVITLYKTYPQVENANEIFDNMAGVLKLKHTVLDPREYSYND